MPFYSDSPKSSVEELLVYLRNTPNFTWQQLDTWGRDIVATDQPQPITNEINLEIIKNHLLFIRRTMDRLGLDQGVAVFRKKVALYQIGQIFPEDFLDHLMNSMNVLPKFSNRYACLTNGLEIYYHYCLVCRGMDHFTREVGGSVTELSWAQPLSANLIAEECPSIFWNTETLDYQIVHTHWPILRICQRHLGGLACSLCHRKQLSIEVVSWRDLYSLHTHYMRSGEEYSRGVCESCATINLAIIDPLHDPRKIRSLLRRKKPLGDPYKK